MTHAGLLDGVRNLDEKLLIVRGVLAAHEDLDGELIGLELVEVFGCRKWLVSFHGQAQDGWFSLGHLSWRW